MLSRLQGQNRYSYNNIFVSEAIRTFIWEIIFLKHHTCVYNNNIYKVLSAINILYNQRAHLSVWITSVSQGSSSHLLHPVDQSGMPLLLCGTVFCESPRLWVHSPLQILCPRTTGGCWFCLLGVHRAQLFCDSSWAWPDPAPAGPRTFLVVDRSNAADPQNSRIYSSSSPVVSSSLWPSWWCPCLSSICLRLWGAAGVLCSEQLGA